MSETQPPATNTSSQSTSAAATPTDVLPNREDLVAINNVLSAGFRFRESLVRKARVHGTLTSPQVRFRDLCKDLNVPACPELKGLTKHGLKKNWQFAALSPTKFAELVPDCRERQLIESFMANEYGLFHDTAFSESNLRALQGRPLDIFATPGVAEFLKRRLGQEVDGLPRFSGWELGVFNICSVYTVGDLLLANEQTLDRVDEGVRHCPALEQLFALIKSRNLWPGLKLTTAEQKYWQEHMNEK